MKNEKEKLKDRNVIYITRMEYYYTRRLFLKETSFRIQDKLSSKSRFEKLATGKSISLKRS